MISATIMVTDTQDHLRQVFAPEQQSLLNSRASYTLRREGDKTVIVATAEDATALRALLNSVCKILIIHEKTGMAILNGA